MKLKLLAVSLLVVASWAGSLWSEGWLPRLRCSYLPQKPKKRPFLCVHPHWNGATNS